MIENQNPAQAASDLEQEKSEMQPRHLAFHEGLKKLMEDEATKPTAIVVAAVFFDGVEAEGCFTSDVDREHVDKTFVLARLGDNLNRPFVHYVQQISEAQQEFLKAKRVPEAIEGLLSALHKVRASVEEAH